MQENCRVVLVFAYVKDGFVPENDARISIAERGFRFGDGVFETIRVQNKAFYQLDSHISRLRRGLEALKMDADTTALPEICRELLQRNKVKEGILRLSVSRGVGSTGYLPRVSGGVTLVVETLPLPAFPQKPVDVWIGSAHRVSNASLGGAKTMQGLNSTLARMEAVEQGCFEALMLTDDETIGEGSSANIFWYRDGMLYTPDVRAGIVSGTIRGAVLRLSPYPVQTGVFTLQELLLAEEVFFTNVAWLVLPVREIKPLGKRVMAHGVSAQLRQLLIEDIARATT